MLIPGSAKKTAVAKFSVQERTPPLPPIVILLDCMTCVARELKRLFFSQSQEHSNKANINMGGNWGGRTSYCRVILSAAVFFADPGTNINSFHVRNKAGGGCVYVPFNKIVSCITSEKHSAGIDMYVV